jgi:hypothetical protein
MDRRTKILAGGLGAVVALLFVARVAYPAWIAPLLTIDDRVRERHADLQELEQFQMAVDRARADYRDFVARNGSFDFGRVENAVRDRLNALIARHKLENASTAPSRPVVERKTGLIRSTITVTAVGSLESAVSFLKDLSEIPELVRVDNPTLSPASAGRRGQAEDSVNLRVPIELLVLPKNRTAGHIDPETLSKPETFVRHAAQNYALIWERTPFTPYVELQPLRVDVQRMLNVEVGQPGILQATASGGDGQYKYEWSPKEGLVEPTLARTNVDTSAPRTQSYTVSVIDGVKDREPVTATVAVTVREPKPAARPEPAPTEPPPPPRPVAAQWPEAPSMIVVMTLLRNAGNTRTNELMVNNTRTRETNYYKVMDDFDGGKLVYVHQTGGVVWRGGKYFVYPLGATLADCIEYQQAEAYPELRSAAERAVALETARVEARQKESPPENPPGGAVLDSRGGTSGPAGAAAALERPRRPVTEGAEGPLAPTADPQTDNNETVGPPDPAPAAAMPPAGQPGDNAQPPARPARPTSTDRPRPGKNPRPGRL